MTFETSWLMVRVECSHIILPSLDWLSGCSIMNNAIDNTKQSGDFLNL